MRRLRQCADDASPRQIDLECIVLVAFGVAQQQVGRARKTGLVCRLSAQHRFCRGVTPRLVRDTAERKTRLLDRSAFEFQDGGKEWTVLFHDLQGFGGQLSVFYGGIDGLDATPLDKPLVAPELLDVASNAIVFGTA